MMNPHVDYCWKCLLQERDPVLGTPIWWWHLPEQPDDSVSIQTSNVNLSKVA